MILVTREAERLLDEALDLPEDERAELAAILSESVGHGASFGEIEAEWIAEAKRRLEDIRAGRGTTIPSEDVERELDEIGSSEKFVGACSRPAGGALVSERGTSRAATLGRGRSWPLRSRAAGLDIACA